MSHITLEDRKYLAIKKIVDEHQIGKVEGIQVDAFTASMLLTICDSLSPKNRDKFLSLTLPTMISWGWKLYK